MYKQVKQKSFEGVNFQVTGNMPSQKGSFKWLIEKNEQSVY